MTTELHARIEAHLAQATGAEAQVRAALPSDAASAGAVNAFIGRYQAESRRVDMQMRMMQAPIGF